MTFQTSLLLQELTAQTRSLASFAHSLSRLDDDALQRRPHAQAWNVLECLEHLNRYGDFYLPAVQRAIAAAPPANEKTFKSGWLGNYFVKSMEPTAGMKKMKTFPDKDPLHAPLQKSVTDRFQEQQEAWLKLLEEAQKVSLQRTKVPLSIAPWLKLRLGDVFRFVIIHEIRHRAQIERILAEPAGR